MTLQSDRDRRYTAASVLQRIDEATIESLQRHAEAGPDTVSARLRELEREWDIDRAVELESSLMGLASLALGAFAGRAFLAVPAAVGASVFLHAVLGWYPLLPLLRRAGLRTAREISRERYALKALRGDFRGMETHAGALARRAPESPVV